MYKNDPRSIRAKYNSICAETGRTIAKGDECVYYPLTKKVYHLESHTAADFYQWSYDAHTLNYAY